MQEAFVAHAKIDDSFCFELGIPSLSISKKGTIGFRVLVEVVQILETDNFFLALSYDKPESAGTGGFGWSLAVSQLSRFSHVCGTMRAVIRNTTISLD